MRKNYDEYRYILNDDEKFIIDLYRHLTKNPGLHPYYKLKNKMFFHKMIIDFIRLLKPISLHEENERKENKNVATTV